jgi:UDP-N-acetylglucosamine acyltransferase
MKWSKLPDWAKFITQDSCGTWRYWENRPRVGAYFDGWSDVMNGKMKVAHSYIDTLHSANIHPTAVIYDNVIIEEGVKIGAYCVIGAPPEIRLHDGDGWGVYIGKGTIITGHCTIDSGSQKMTEIGEHCYIMKQTHIGHDCIIGDEVILSPGARIGGHCIVERGVKFGMNSTVHQRSVIGEHSIIGMNSTITKTTKVEPFTKYVGSPARKLSLSEKNYDREEIERSQKRYNDIYHSDTREA